MPKTKIVNVFYSVIIFTVGIQVLSMLRTTLLAKQFGVSSEMDAFNLANLMMVAIVNIGGAAIPTVVIPFLTNVSEEQLQKARRVLNSYLVTILSVSLFFLILVYLMGFVGMEYFHWKVSEPFYYMTYLLTFIMGAGQLFRMYSWLQISNLEVEGKFIWIKAVGFIATFLNLLFLLFYGSQLTIYQIALSVAFSFLIEATLLACSNRKWAFRFSFAFRSDEYKRLIRLTLPSLFGAILYQVTILLPNLLGSYFGTGYISMMTYANQIISIFQVLLVTNLLSMIYPNLSRSFQESLQIGKAKFIQYMKLLVLLIVPVVAGMLVLGREVISLLFERGSFDSASSAQVFQFLLFLLLSLPFTVFKELTFKIFYSLGDTVTPVVNSTLTIIFQILFLIVGVFKIGVITLMISPLVVALFALILAILVLAKKMSFKYEFAAIAKETGKSVVNAAIMAGIIYVVKESIAFSSEIINLVFYAVIGVIVYGLLTTIMDFRFVQQFLPGKNRTDKEGL
ncbi:teichoic acid/polysaccharide export protein [Listeria kieliensis]|uniref:Teichoic acid/polysaccharide export protein n=1 Tax=Listeria kieliensis TaxID=1621700 RepID=A0A3D8TLD3_9LIST|nr:teichoic acid/polysaccharide export protein [Listeria kieliensis]